MADRGVFAIDRGLYNAPEPHPFFKDEAFTEREAWVWMIGDCAFELCQRRVGRAVYDLKRGQLVAATRFMAGKWKWTESRVRRLIERLKSEGMIDAAPTKEATVITVCNYDDYQFGRRAAEALPDEPATHPRRKEEITQEPNTLGSGGGRPHGGVICEEAHAFADEIARICGLDPEFLPPQWVSKGPALRIHMMMGAGWHIDVMREAAKAAMRTKRDGPPNSILYFDKIFARAHAPQLPLPPVQVVTASRETSNATTIDNNRPTGWQHSRDKFREGRAALKDRIAEADGAPDGGSESSGQVVRLTPASRRR